MRWIVFFLLIPLCCPHYVFARSSKNTSNSFLLRCDGTGCSEPRRRDEKDATHIAFTLEKGRNLLFEIKNLRTVVQATGALQQRKIELKNQEIALQTMQLSQAQKTVLAQSKRITDLKNENRELTKENQKLASQAAKYRGERFKFMIIGFAVGAGVVLAGGIAVGVFLATR